MNFQKKVIISFEAIVSDEFGMPQFEDFHLQRGQGFSFIQLPALLKISLTHKGKPTKRPVLPKTSKVLSAPDKICSTIVSLSYKYLGKPYFWARGSLVTTGNLHENALHLKTLNESKLERTLYSKARGFITQGYTLLQHQ